MDGTAFGARELVPGLFGNHPSMVQLAEQVKRFARSRQSVLLQGESGTGKDIVARAIHKLSGRGGDYFAVNAACLSDSLADAELFGATRGAYTGSNERMGAFEAADEGTLFLDEVSALPPMVQAKLLRVVEDGSVRRIGSMKARRLDVRLITATHVPLLQAVRDGAFREDLYYRLSTVVLTVPPLRARKSDLRQLARVLLERFTEEIGACTLCDEAAERLALHDWPGNVRELGSVLYRAGVASEDGVIRAENLTFDVPLPSREPSNPRGNPANASKVLEECGGNVSRAAAAMGVPRSTFRSWLARAPRGDS